MRSQQAQPGINNIFEVMFGNSTDCILVYRLNDIGLEFASPSAQKRMKPYVADKNDFNQFRFLGSEGSRNIHNLIDIIKKSGNIDSFETTIALQAEPAAAIESDVLGKTIFIDADIFLILFFRFSEEENNPVPVSDGVDRDMVPAGAAPESGLMEEVYSQANEFKEPLRNISTYIQLLQNNYETTLDDTGKQFLAFAMEGADRLKKVVEKMDRYSLAMA